MFGSGRRHLGHLSIVVVAGPRQVNVASAMMSAWRRRPCPTMCGRRSADGRSNSWTVTVLLAAASSYAAGVARARRLGRPLATGRWVAFAGGWVILAFSLVSPIDSYADVSFTVHMLSTFCWPWWCLPCSPSARPSRSRFARFPLPGHEPSREPCGLESRACSAIPWWDGRSSSERRSSCTRAACSTWRSAPPDGTRSSTACGSAPRWSTGGPSSASTRARIPSDTAPASCRSSSRCRRCRSSLSRSSAEAPLYPTYASSPSPWGPQALGDQGNAAVLMWVAGNLVLVIAMLLVAASWKRHDDASQARLEAREDEAARSIA